jgi:PAS domain S-box-containing protein
MAGAQAKPLKRVLVLNEVGTSYPLTNLVDEGMRTALSEVPFRIEFYREYMDTVLFPDSAVQQRVRDFYVHKYENRTPDVIITVGPSPLKFMIETHQRVFPGVPVVFCVPNGLPGSLTLDSDFTGVEGEISPQTTLAAALRLQPGTKHVLIVGGTAAFDRQQQAVVREQLRSYEGKLDISYLTDLAMPALLERLKKLPTQTIVLLTSISQDGAGTPFISSESGPMITAAANAPVFSLSDRFLNHGEVGGDVSSAFEQGKTAGGMALRILQGEKPQDIAPVRDAATYMFDWGALKRWGMKEKNLPADSVVLNRLPTAWENNRWYIISGISLILLEALLISSLLWQRERRRKAETELGVTYDRLRLAVEAGKSVGWDWDVKSGQDRRFGDLETIFGIPADTYSGQIEDFRRCVHPDDRERVWKAVEDARQNRKPYVAEFRVVRPDGAVRWINAKGQFYFAHNGDAERMLGIAVDITDRKQAEEAVRESEERFRLVANTAPVLIWMSGPNRVRTYFNQPWLEFTGQPLAAELRNGWEESVYPEDLGAFIDTYSRAFDRRESYQTEFRLRRYDGEYRWIFDIGVPRLNADGSFAGYIGSCLDVTERKLAEEALANLSGRLIDAQEQERKRIAREIHDDYNQRLAVVANELEGLADVIADSPAEAARQLHTLWNNVSELGADLHSLSHRLHSSTLENLGLVAGTKAFCEEFADQQGIKVDFLHENVPRCIPPDLSLCLFRIVQEGLRNVKRHSGADRAEVRLEGFGDTLHVRVADRGKGFDVSRQSETDGIGIRSMEERLRSLGGQLEIYSRPTKGTRIEASLPLKVAMRRAS